MVGFRMLKYEKVAKQIEQYIKENNLEQGDKLPKLDHLTERFAVSKSTIIKALDILEIRGMIYQVRGSGIFVRQHRRKGFINLTESQGFGKSLSDFQLDSKVLELSVIKPDEYMMKYLHLDEDDEVYYLRRVRVIEGRPFCIEDSFYSKKVIVYLNKEIAEKSVYQYLIDDLKLNIGFSDSFFRIGQLNHEEAMLLEEPENAATLRVESIYYLHNGQPFNYSVLKYHKDQAQFFVPGQHY